MGEEFVFCNDLSYWYGRSKIELQSFFLLFFFIVSRTSFDSWGYIRKYYLGRWRFPVLMKDFPNWKPSWVCYQFLVFQENNPLTSTNSSSRNHIGSIANKCISIKYPCILVPSWWSRINPCSSNGWHNLVSGCILFLGLSEKLGLKADKLCDAIYT